MAIIEYSIDIPLCHWACLNALVHVYTAELAQRLYTVITGSAFIYIVVFITLVLTRVHGPYYTIVVNNIIMGLMRLNTTRLHKYMVHYPMHFGTLPYGLGVVYNRVFYTYAPTLLL